MNKSIESFLKLHEDTVFYGVAIEANDLRKFHKLVGLLSYETNEDYLPAFGGYLAKDGNFIYEPSYIVTERMFNALCNTGLMNSQESVLQYEVYKEEFGRTFSFNEIEIYGSLVFKSGERIDIGNLERVSNPDPDVLEKGFTYDPTWNAYFVCTMPVEITEPSVDRADDIDLDGHWLERKTAK